MVDSKEIKRPMDIVLVVVLGPLLFLNGLFILIMGLMLMKTDAATKIGAVILLVVAAPLEFLFWKLIQSPIRRLKTTSESGVHPNGLHYAGFGARLAAGFIDLLIFMPFAVVPYFLSSWNIQKFEFYFWGSFLYYPYIVMMVSRYGQTIGKMVVGITVFQDDGSPVTLKTSFKRASVDLLIGAVLIYGHLHSLSKIDLGFGFATFREAYDYFDKTNPTSTYGSLIGLVWYSMEYLTLLFNKRKKAIHDFIGGTLVLVTRDVK